MKFTHFLKVLPFFMGLLLPQSLEYALISLNNACYIHCFFFSNFNLIVMISGFLVYNGSFTCNLSSVPVL